MKTRFGVVMFAFGFFLHLNALTLSVTSTNQGGGLFSYTFADGENPDFICGFFDGAYILIQSRGVLEVMSPPGWIATVDENEAVSWTRTNGLVYLFEPLTFSIRSCIEEEAWYDEIWQETTPQYYRGGLAVASGFNFPSLILEAGGYQFFSYLGPARAPELRITCNESAINIRWPVSSDGFVLQSKPSSSSNSWETMRLQPMIELTNFVVSVTITNEARFFRLFKDCP